MPSNFYVYHKHKRGKMKMTNDSNGGFCHPNQGVTITLELLAGFAVIFTSSTATSPSVEFEFAVWTVILWLIPSLVLFNNPETYFTEVE
ncbi:hypothetical protein BDP27DRAFT_1330526 [Rhodocollybia butyracea]|uniref:Uncharacterized protein n=1 Tax=Rhodocollybia butyracea TaxID=206335 RepID=A0A9P5PM73_9AGAR|nr:hypothetical protein BDP27DRAFT_1330526 [Rhodocollybia butyracea]